MQDGAAWRECRSPGDLFDLIGQDPRRSRKMTHSCLDKVTHTENTIWNRIQNTIRNRGQHHPRRRRATLAARQKSGYLTRTEPPELLKSPLQADGSRLARAKSVKFTVWVHSDSGGGADRPSGSSLPSKPGSFFVSAEGLAT